MSAAQDSKALADKQPVVLLSCGSFNPPTVMHLRMFDLARHALQERGHPVVGAVMSPVNDAYKKPNLVAGRHRMAMSNLAAKELPYLQASDWEASQPEYQKTLQVMNHISKEFNSSPQQHTGAGTAEARVMLLAGADLLGTFLVPDVWAEEDQEAILGDYGVVGITRESADIEELLAKPGTSLNRHQQNIIVVDEPITNDISATTIRSELAKERPVRFLVPEGVISYIKEHKLYTSPDLKK